MTEGNKLFLPDFVDLYMSYLTKLLEASPKGLLDIYEFSAQYFEKKLKERCGKTKSNDRKTVSFQRDVPNDPGKRQFLPDFSYDSVLILHPELSSPYSSFEENTDNLLNKEMQVIHHLNNPINQQKHERNLLKQSDAFQKNGGTNRFTYQDNDPDEHTKAFLEDQKFLRREREKVEKIYENGRQENYNGSLDNDSKVQKKQKIIIDLEKFLKDFNQEKMMDNNRDRKDNLKLSNNNENSNFDKASNTDNNQDLAQKYFLPVPPNRPKVHQQKRKKNTHPREQQEDELEKRNIHPSEQHKNKMKLQTIKTSDKAKTFINAQFTSKDEVLNQIVEFSKLLPKCLEVMNKLFNDLEIKTQDSKDQKDNSHFISQPSKILHSFPAVLNEACENETDKQKIRPKTFCTTSSQTDFAEPTNINSSVLTSAMFEYVCDVIKAARRLLYSVTIKNCNHLPFGEINDGLSIPKENNIGYKDFENILESWKNLMNKPENASFRIDQNYINEALEKKHLDNERYLDENKNAWQYESNKEPEDCEVHGKSDLNHDLDKDLNHTFEPQKNNQNKNEYACSLFQQEICHQNENCCDDCNSDKKTTRKQEQDNKISNASRSNKKSSNHSVEQNKKSWDDINGPKERHNDGSISRSQSDSAISLQSNQDAYKKDLARAFLLRLEKICQTDERYGPFFRSSPGIIQISTQEPSTGIEKTLKSTGGTKSRESEESLDLETEHKGKKSFSLLDSQRYPTEKKKKKPKNLFYKIPKDNKAKDNHDEKLHDFEKDEGMKYNGPDICSDSEKRDPIHTDSSSFFISAPILHQPVQNFPELALEKKFAKSTGDVPKEMALQFRMRDERRKRFKRKLRPEDKLEDPRMGGFFTLLDPKRSFGGRKEISYQKLAKVDFGTMAVEAEIDAEGRTKLVVHDIHQATSKLQMNILKSRQVYKEAALKMRPKSFDDNWHVSATGKSWLRSYFTTRMIKRYQKQLESDKIDTETEDLGTPVLKHCECKYGLGSYFSQRSLLGSIRMWYFSKKLREYQKSFNS